MSKSKTPMPAPKGLKWVVCSTGLWDGTNPYLSLALWPEGAIVDRDGTAYSEPLKRAVPNFAKGARFRLKPEARRDFQWERQIRRTSKGVLRDYRRGNSQERLVGDL